MGTPLVRESMARGIVFWPGSYASMEFRADAFAVPLEPVARHGSRRKVHLAMDTVTSDIRAVEFTPSSDGDGPVLPELLNQIPEGEEIGTVTTDGVYDTRRCHTAIIDRQATPIIPIHKNGRPWKEDCPAARARNETLRATRHYGRASWKRWTGYHIRSRIEAKMPSQVRSNLWR